MSEGCREFRCARSTAGRIAAHLAGQVKLSESPCGRSIARRDSLRVLEQEETMFEEACLVREDDRMDATARMGRAGRGGLMKTGDQGLRRAARSSTFQ